MGNYRKKPVVIEAIQFTGNNFFEIHEFTNGNAHDCYMQPAGYTTCIINTLEGRHIATEGDYIIKGVQGEFYPCKPDVFNMTYEAADRLKTNADRIRAMNDYELAEFLYGFAYGVEALGACWDCQGEALEWLREPAEREKENGEE